jgi:hypothetical protein
LEAATISRWRTPPLHVLFFNILEQQSLVTIANIKGNKGIWLWETKRESQNRFRQTQKLQNLASAKREFGIKSIYIDAKPNIKFYGQTTFDTLKRTFEGL